MLNADFKNKKMELYPSLPCAQRFKNKENKKKKRRNVFKFVLLSSSFYEWINTVTHVCRPQCIRQSRITFGCCCSFEGNHPSSRKRGSIKPARKQTNTLNYLNNMPIRVNVYLFYFFHLPRLHRSSMTSKHHVRSFGKTVTIF